ncbi:MAG: ABC transporter permease [Chlamydiota bacterium]|nr:ABC transporter permease [Chlamydiota bacterium]
MSLCILLFLGISSLVIPMVSQHTYHHIDVAAKNMPPSLLHWFGTDDLGRDLFVRIWCGARISLSVGLIVACVDTLFGTLYGAIAALFGGKIDMLMMRFTDVLHSLPWLLIVILLAMFMPPSLTTTIIALTLTGWINMARMIRGDILKTQNEDFVKAAWIMGASRSRVLLRHLIPQTTASMMTMLTLTVPSAIFAESLLSFMGIGVRLPEASWGLLAKEGLTALIYHPWRLFFPGAFISLTILCCNLLGESIKKALNPLETA